MTRCWVMAIWSFFTLWLDAGHRTPDTRHQTPDIGHASDFIFCPMKLCSALHGHWTDSNVLLHTNPDFNQSVTSWVHPHSWTSSDRPAVAWPSELVIDRIEVMAVGGGAQIRRDEVCRGFALQQLNSFTHPMRWCAADSAVLLFFV